jgi:L-ascorbate metabolism protein UlaG (beta-lactamase superfamily)
VDILKKFPDGLAMKPGERRSLDGISIEAVPAYNTDKQFHPKANTGLGYVVTIDGVRIYHAGDTDRIPEMRLLERIDIALLPVSGTYVMTADEAVLAAMDFMPKKAVPMHYGSIVGDMSDAENFMTGLSGKVPVEILKKQ